MPITDSFKGPRVPTVKSSRGDRLMIRGPEGTSRAGRPNNEPGQPAKSNLVIEWDLSARLNIGVESGIPLLVSLNLIKGLGVTSRAIKFVTL